MKNISCDFLSSSLVFLFCVIVCHCLSHSLHSPFLLVVAHPFPRGPGDIIGDCKVQFLDEIYQVEKPGARALSAADGQFKRMQKHPFVPVVPVFKRTIPQNRLKESVRICRFLFQGRAGRSVSTAKLILIRSVGSVPAACAEESRMLTCSYCVTSVTWHFTFTASTRPWPTSRMMRTGEKALLSN